MDIDKLRRALQRYRDQYIHSHDLPRELISHLTLRKNAMVMRITAPGEKEPLRPEVYLRRNAGELEFIRKLILEKYKMNVIDGYFTPRRIGRKGVIFELALLFDKNLQSGSVHEKLEEESLRAATGNIARLSKRIPEKSSLYICDSRFSLLVFEGFYSQYELSVMKEKKWREQKAAMLADIMRLSVEEMGYGARLKSVHPWFCFDTNRGFVLVEFKRTDNAEWTGG